MDAIILKHYDPELTTNRSSQSHAHLSPTCCGGVTTPPIWLDTGPLLLALPLSSSLPLLLLLSPPLGLALEVRRDQLHSKSFRYLEGCKKINLIITTWLSQNKNIAKHKTSDASLVCACVCIMYVSVQLLVCAHVHGQVNTQERCFQTDLQPFPVYASVSGSEWRKGNKHTVVQWTHIQNVDISTNAHNTQPVLAIKWTSKFPHDADRNRNFILSKNTTKWVCHSVLIHSLTFKTYQNGLFRK